MAFLTRTPGTCSLQNMTGLRDLGNVEGDLQAMFTRERNMGDGGRFSAVFGVCTTKAQEARLLQAGFKAIATYRSHWHGTDCRVMFRKISKKEWDTRKLNLPKRKGHKR